MKRFWILFGAFVVSAATLGVALMLGTWAFEYRRYSQHETRLERVMAQEPTMARLTEGLANEGTTILAAPETARGVEIAIDTHGEAAADTLRQKARRWPSLRVYRSADMIYFIFFDDDDIMRDFACVGA
jgi:hypothetical protein